MLEGIAFYQKRFGYFMALVIEAALKMIGYEIPKSLVSYILNLADETRHVRELMGSTQRVDKLADC